MFKTKVHKVYVTRSIKLIDGTNTKGRNGKHSATINIKLAGRTVELWDSPFFFVFGYYCCCYFFALQTTHTCMISVKAHKFRMKFCINNMKRT